MPSRPTAKLAYIISSHGFGHAARSCAVIEALRHLDGRLEIEVWSGVPEWFFADSLQRPITVHPRVTDLGLVQSDALEEDLTATLERLPHWVPSPTDRRDSLLSSLRRRRISHVVCDISPLGLDAAKAGGYPSALVENFTWDWIYRGYAEEEPALLPFAERLAESFATADLRLQLEPLCAPRPGASVCPPVSRRPRMDRRALRRRLGVPWQAPMVLVTMGGIEWDYGDLEQRLRQLDGGPAQDGPWLVIPGSCEVPQQHGRLVRLPHRSDFYHPDLIHAADAVLGKLGYSTIAEVWSAGVPFAYIPRRRFPESPPLEAWVGEHLPSLRITPQQFAADRWLERLPQLLSLPRRDRAAPSVDGAEVVAGHLLRWLGA